MPPPGGATSRPVKSGDRSPHSIKGGRHKQRPIAKGWRPVCFGVRRVPAAFDGATCRGAPPPPRAAAGGAIPVAGIGNSRLVAGLPGPKVRKRPAAGREFPSGLGFERSDSLPVRVAAEPRDISQMSGGRRRASPSTQILTVRGGGFPVPPARPVRPRRVFPCGFAKP
jgi:hypothetical protein